MDDKLKISIYRNPRCEAHLNQECYLVYFSEKGIFISTPDDIFNLLDIPFYIIDDNNIDSFSEVRGFEKVLELKEDNRVDWFNNYEEHVLKIHDDIYEIRRKLNFKLRYKLPSDQNLFKYYLNLGTIAEEIME